MKGTNMKGKGYKRGYEGEGYEREGKWDRYEGEGYLRRGISKGRRRG